ncbi:MAG: SgcJ/EcaC family oxidoreductase [Sphingobacteriia bacterium]|nr:SgcJ/EcaC family oxidoreductase [Sphingobacteriia bacterium]
MRNYFFVTVVLLSVVFSGCTNQCSELTDHGKLTIEKQLLDEWEKIMTTIEDSDSEAYASFISPELILMSSEGAVFYSKAAYIDNVRNWFATRKSTAIQQKKIIVTPLKEDIALLDQESDFVVTYQDSSIQKVHHAVSFVFKKEGPGWRIIHGHESFNNME